MSGWVWGAIAAVGCYAAYEWIQSNCSGNPFSPVGAVCGYPATPVISPAVPMPDPATAAPSANILAPVPVTPPAQTSITEAQQLNAGPVPAQPSITTALAGLGRYS